MLQELSVAFAQVKAGNTLENSLNKIRQIICSFIQKWRLLKQYITHNEFNTDIIQIEYYYEFRK